MMKKYNVVFSSKTAISPSFVFISPSDGYPGHFSVGILHPKVKSGVFDSASGIVMNYDLKQNLCSSELAARSWATDWLSQSSGCTATLSEVSDKA